MRALIALFVVGLLAACRPELPPPARLLGVSPQGVRAGVRSGLQVAGEGFALRVQVDLDSPERSQLRGSYAVRLERDGALYMLEDLQRVSPELLTAEISAGVPPGRFAVTVLDPWGRILRTEDTVLVAAECLEPSTCDDGRGCTTDTCEEGVCRRTLQEARCLIDGACYAAGETGPGGGCQRCEPALATDAWVEVEDGTACDDDSPCTSGDTCSSGSCRGAAVCGDTAPRACLSVSAALIAVPGAVVLDPTCSEDLESETAALEARFDTDGDGTFDTAFEPLAPRTVTLEVPGIRHLSVEVRDPAGNLASTGRHVIAALPDEVLWVTTPQDEADEGATAIQPLGTGLSLREAISIANAEGRARRIGFARAMTLQASALPALAPPGAAIVGRPGVSLDFGAAGGPCLTLADDQRLIALRVLGCADTQVRLSGSGSQVVDSVLSLGGGDGLLLSGTDNSAGPEVEISGFGGRGVIVRGERNAVGRVNLHHNGQAGVQLAPQAVETLVSQVRSWSNEGPGVQLSAQALRTRLLQSTIHGNGGDGVDVHPLASEIDLRGNLLTENLGFGVCGPEAAFTAQSPNASWQNGLGAVCAGSVAAPSFEADPGYVRASGDFRLRAGSPAIDASVALELDLNGASAGSWFGTLPDLGAVESPH